jgi:type II secretory pathway predicted ATPase ExeA
MASLEQVEISRYQQELIHDLRHLVQKYGRIMGWEVPELDEAEAKRLILQALKEALADVEREG